MRLRALSAAVAWLALATAPAATFTVTTSSDGGPGSLREAILDANATPGDDAVVFATSGTVVLASSLPPVTDNIVIVGPGTNQLTISGNGSVQILSFQEGTTNTLSGLTIANGLATGYTNGAGIANAGVLTISNCAIVNNQASGGWGGGAFNSGDLRAINCVFAGNAVTGGDGSASPNYGGAGGGGAGAGGGLFTMSGSALILGCTFINNSALGGNGGDWRGVAGGDGRGGGSNGGALGAYMGDGGAGGFGGGGGGGEVCGNGGVGGVGAGGGGGGDCPDGPAAGGPRGLGGGAGGSGNQAGSGGNGGGGGGIGGAVLIHSGSVTISNSSITANSVCGGHAGTAQTGGPAATAGGGIGGGLFVYGGTVWLTVCTVGGNQVVGAGEAPDFYNYAGTVLPTLTATTAGGGAIPQNPQGPPYLNNAPATVTAQPAPGWTFLQWLGDASGTNPQVTLGMNRNKYVEALFGTGISYSGPVSVSPLSPVYPYGTLLKLTAIPPPGTFFTSWAGDAGGTNNPTTLTITNPSLSVSCQLGTLAPGETSLTVIESGRGHVALSPRRYLYSISETAGLIPVPDPGQEFVGWTGDAAGTQNPLLVSMISSKVITANFTKRPSLRVGTPLEGLAEEGFRLTLIGEFGTNYAVLASTNLTDWAQIGTVTSAYGIVQFTDPTATSTVHRFYRALTDVHQ